VLKALGKGSYGTVYKVQRLEDGGVYAMKETDLGRMGPKERQDAVNEIRVLGSMNHPNVVRHHETFVSGETGAVEVQLVQHRQENAAAGRAGAAAAEEQWLRLKTVVCRSAPSGCC
jgi:serine/threonine protein kinase